MNNIQKFSQDFKDRADALIREAEAFKNQELNKQLEALAVSLKETADDMAWQRQTAPYVEFKESEQHILDAAAQITAANVKAVDEATGTETFIRLNADHSEAFSFGSLRPGSVVKIAGSDYIVADEKVSYAGNTYALVPATSKAYILDPGEKQNPFNSVPCSFDSSTMTLKVAKIHAVGPGQTISINGAIYTPKNLIGTPDHHRVYELEPAI